MASRKWSKETKSAFISMELGLDFEDEDLRRKTKEKGQILTSYNAKICHPEWFLTAKGDDDESRSNISKFQADYYYGKREYLLAANSYREGIALLSSQNRVMKRDMLESLSRCYAYLGDVKNALTIVEDLKADAATSDNIVQVLVLKQQTLNKFLMLEDEIDVIKQLIGYHPHHVPFWLLLLVAYKRSFPHNSKPLSSYMEMNQIHKSNRSDKDGLSEKLDVKLTLQDDVAKVSQTEMPSRTENTHSRSSEDKTKDNPDSYLHANVQKNINSSDPSQTVLQKSDIINVNEAEETDKTLSSICDYNYSNSNENAKETSVKKDRAVIKNDGAVCQLMLLTCWIRVRLLLKSVHGTVGSFFKIRNQELQNQVDEEIKELQPADWIVEAAIQFMRRDLYDFYEAGDEDVDDISVVKPQKNNKVSTASTTEFNERWFSWIKNVTK